MNHNTWINTNSIKDTVEELYDIVGPIQCEFIRRSFNDHYLIRTVNEKYILRVYFNNKYYIKDSEDFNFELELLTYLAVNNAPVSYPIMSKNNCFLNKVRYNNETRFITLFSYAEGTPLKSILEEHVAIQFGESIANLHMLMGKFKCKHRRYKISIEYLIDEPIHLLEEYALQYGLGNLEFFKQYAKNLRTQLENLPFNDKTYGLIHADLNPSNIHLDKLGNLTLFDFDHCAFGWKIHDLAVVKLCYAEATYKNFVFGYNNKRELESVEERLISAYTDALLIRKYKDILCMMDIADEIGNDKGFNRKEFVSSAIDSLHDLVSRR